MTGPAARVVDVLREAVTAAWGQRVPSTVSMLVVAGVTTAILVTTGQTVASERRVLTQINSPAGRLVVLTDDQGAAHVDSTSIEAISRLEGVEWVLGFGAALDVTNSGVRPGPSVAARQVYGEWPSALTSHSYRSPQAGDALLGPAAAEHLGFLNPIGGVAGAGVDSPVVGGFRATAPLEDLNSGVLVKAGARRGVEVRTIRLSVRDVADIRTVTAAARAVLVARDAAQLREVTSEDLADLQRSVGSELSQSSRRLVWIVLAAGTVLITITQFGAVAQRARDYGRRRALGATRTGIVVHVLVQVGLCALLGTIVGCGIGLVADWRLAGAFPGIAFTGAVSALSLVAALVASLPPALRAAYRDPVRILRVP